jgi:membrane peptidoglycan carboxypeptidase
MVSIDPHTGAILAMVGSAFPNQDGGQFNMAVWPRNPGSSMKLWTYSAAIESGRFSMTTPIADSPVSICQPGFCNRDPQKGPTTPLYQPKNYDGRYHGTCVLQACIGNSLNVPAVKVELGTGIDRVVDVARRVGAPPLYTTDFIHYTSNTPSSVFGAALTLGTYAETVLQQATGAATLAAMGVYHQPYGIARIVTNEGKEIQAPWNPGKNAKQVLDPRVAFIMAQILSNNQNRAMIFGPNSPLTLPNRRVAAKTGTTEAFTDAWTVGFTPSMASAFWFGDPYYRAMQTGFDAVFAAAPAWHVYMDEALGAINAPTSEWYGPPPDLTVNGTSNGQPVYLLPGTRNGQPPPPLPSWASSSSGGTFQRGRAGG